MYNGCKHYAVINGRIKTRFAHLRRYQLKDLHLPENTFIERCRDCGCLRQKTLITEMTPNGPIIRVKTKLIENEQA